MRRWTLMLWAAPALLLAACTKPAPSVKPGAPPTVTAPATPAQANPAQANTAQANTAQANPAQANTAQANPARANTAQANTARANTAQANAAQAKAAQPAGGGATVSASAKAAAAAEAARYSQRRKRKPAVIGGCDEACATPQLAAAALFDGLQSETPGSALRHLFDWSLLELDGDSRGDRWSDMWGDRRKHAARNREIQAWLDGWIAVLQQAKPDALLRSRASGVQIKPIAGRTDVVEMRWRHPALPTGGGEREWRLLWTLRGYEWLISRVDRQPSKRPLGTPPLGSVRRGRL